MRPTCHLLFSSPILFFFPFRRSLRPAPLSPRTARRPKPPSSIGLAASSPLASLLKLQCSRISRPLLLPPPSLCHGGLEHASHGSLELRGLELPPRPWRPRRCLLLRQRLLAGGLERASPATSSTPPMAASSAPPRRAGSLISELPGRRRTRAWWLAARLGLVTIIHMTCNK